MAKIVKLDDDVYQDVASVGEFKESYSDVIRRLVKFYKNAKGTKSKK